jgi:putative NIF3 family GTP cyclohydrolase 1 type 2
MPLHSSEELSRSRRNFVTSAARLGLLSLTGGSLLASASRGPKSYTVKEIIDLILKQVPREPIKDTVDTLKAGDETQTVSGIVTTMFATVDVIKKAIALKANFIIAHEPTFYNHLDETTWLEQDDVYAFKRKLLTDNGMAVWRFHDYIHSFKPDGVRLGVLQALGWESYYNPENPPVMLMPSTTVGKLIDHCKLKLGIKQVRLVGNRDETCTKIGLLPGAIGGKAQIRFMQKEHPDVLIVGEIQEWETSEYIRDLRAMGRHQSLVVLGHAVSEEPGLEWFTHWLQPQLEGIKVTHIPSQNPLTSV